jgi:serine/threonine protein kinase
MDEMQIQKQIGEGSFGKVYLAKWKETTVAVKILTSTNGSSDDDFPTRLPNPLLQALEKVQPQDIPQSLISSPGAYRVHDVCRPPSESNSITIPCAPCWRAATRASPDAMWDERLRKPQPHWCAVLDEQEAGMMAAMRHPNVVLYLGVCLDPPCVVTEYCARGSLNDVLKRALYNSKYAEQLDWRVRWGSRCSHMHALAKCK